MFPHASKKLASLGVPWELPATGQGCAGELRIGRQKKVKIPPKCPDMAEKGFPAPRAPPLPPLNSSFLEEPLRKGSRQQMESPLLFPNSAWGTLLQLLILIRRFRRHPPSQRARVTHLCFCRKRPQKQERQYCL